MKSVKATHIFYFLIIAAFLGGITGSAVTFYLLAPSQAEGGPNVIVERFYSNDTISLEQTITGILGKTNGSVVYINSVKYTQTIFGVTASQASGSGFIVSEDGYVVTNNHVVADASNITVVLQNGEEYAATLRGADPLNDVAVLKIAPSSRLKAVEIGDSDNVREGRFVVAIGSPFRLQNTITLGIVSAVNRQLESESGYIIEKVIQTDAAVNPGNSGGPLIDMEGKVIGVNTAIISQSGGSEGIGFAIPINTVSKIYKEIIESGKVTRPWLGVTTVDVNENMVNTWSLGVDYGVLIVDFFGYSPAREAGLMETISTPGKKDFVLGDIIVDIGGQKIQNNAGLFNALLKYKPDEKVEVEVYRDGEFKKFSVTLGERPEGV